jgi:hypothetical protein
LVAERSAPEPRVVAELGRPETPEETAARKAANSRNYRESKTTRNLIVALVSSLALVLLIALVVVRPDQAPRPPVDYKAIAADATASAPLAVPNLPTEWKANKALLSIGNDDIESWYIGFVTPDNQFAAMTQGIAANQSWVAAQLSDLEKTGSTSIDGVEWTLYDNRDDDDPGNFAYAMTAEFGGSNYVLNGTAFEAEFTELAKAVTR